ncbi:MAG: Sec-independent protein translocase subunit TatA [Cellulomonas sp.]
MPMNLKPMEILFIILVVVLLFGAKRLPDLARGVGKSLKILKTEVRDLNDDDQSSTPRAATPGAKSETVPAATVPPVYESATNVAPQPRAPGK